MLQDVDAHIIGYGKVGDKVEVLLDVQDEEDMRASYEDYARKVARHWMSEMVRKRDVANVAPPAIDGCVGGDTASESDVPLPNEYYDEYYDEYYMGADHVCPSCCYPITLCACY
jgi:hypothetical protein